MIGLNHVCTTYNDKENRYCHCSDLYYHLNMGYDEWIHQSF